MSPSLFAVSNPRESPASYCQVGRYTSAGCPECCNYVFSKWLCSAPLRSLRFTQSSQSKLLLLFVCYERFLFRKFPRNSSTALPNKAQQTLGSDWLPQRSKIDVEFVQRMKETTINLFFRTTRLLNPAQRVNIFGGIFLCTF